MDSIDAKIIRDDFLQASSKAGEAGKKGGEDPPPQRGKSGESTDDEEVLEIPPPEDDPEKKKQEEKKQEEKKPEEKKKKEERKKPEDEKDEKAKGRPKGTMNRNKFSKSLTLPFAACLPHFFFGWQMKLTCYSRRRKKLQLRSPNSASSRMRCCNIFSFLFT